MTSPRSNITSSVTHAREVIVLEECCANDDLTPEEVDAEVRRMEMPRFESNVHFLAPQSNGHGPSSSSRMRCCCGWIGPERFEWQDDLCSLLSGDKARHLRGES
jgi:hypothetical protein